MKITFILLVLVGVHPVESVIKANGYVGGAAVIRCPYDRGYEGYSKYLCRGSCPRVGGKDIPIRTEEGQTKAVRGRFSLHDDTTARVFTVTIAGLTAQDSVQYWCGVSTGFGKTDVYSEVELKVAKAPPPSPSTTLCPFTQKTLSPSPSSNTFTSEHTPEPTISHATTGEIQDDNGYSVVMVMMCVLALLLLMVCVMVFAVYQRRESTGDHLASLHKNMCVEEPNDYEMSAELDSVPDANTTTSSTVKSHVGPCQQPSGQLIYSTVRPVRKTPQQPKEDTVFAIYSDILPEGTTSPIMHYSSVEPREGSMVNTPSTLVQNREEDVVYSEVWFPKM